MCVYLVIFLILPHTALSFQYGENFSIEQPMNFGFFKPDEVTSIIFNFSGGKEKNNSTATLSEKGNFTLDEEKVPTLNMSSSPVSVVQENSDVSIYLHIHI